MTVADLRMRTRNLEEAVHHRIEDFERLYKARVASVLVHEPYHHRDDETCRNQEVEVRLHEPIPKTFPTKEKKILQRAVRKMLRKYQRKTGCRVTEVFLGLEGYPVEVRIDVLAYPERLREIRRGSLQESIAGLIYSFENETQGRVSKVKVTKRHVEVRLACSRT